MEREPPAFPGPDFAAEFSPVDPGGQTHGPSRAALVIGILALSCNALLVFAPFGIVLGVIAIIMGAVHRMRHRYAKAGLVLGLLSFVPVAVYAFSIIAILNADPFFRLNLP